MLDLFDRSKKVSIAKSTQVRLLEDLTKTLEKEIIRQLSHFDEPVWRNPLTGQMMSSLSALVTVLNIKTARNYWPAWCDHLRLRQHVLDDVMLRHDLPSRRKRLRHTGGTACIDISSFEQFLYERHPVLARRVFTAFKQEHGLL